MGVARQVTYAMYKDLAPSLSELFRKGGRFQKAANQANTIIGRIQSNPDGDPFQGFALTNHGESRIPHCRKYDLQGACRLITVHDKHLCVLLFCGDHASCDRWLEVNRGFVPVVEDGNVASVTYVSEGGSVRPKVGGAPGHAKGKLYERLDEDMFERLVGALPRKVQRGIEGFESTSNDEDIWTVLNDVPGPDLRRVLYDVLSLLRQDKDKQAKSRAKLFLGSVGLLADVPALELPDIVDSDVIRQFRPTQPHYAEAVKRFMVQANYRDWMLFMHPDQERVVLEDFEGSAKLVGVSGSGKTCVIIQRALRLARLYPTERILVLTLNRALANLIRELVAICGTDSELERIEVHPFFELCRSLILTFEPKAERLYDEVTWKLNEHVDEIWQEYYRCKANNRDAAVMAPIHDSLLPRGWDPERYIREEVDWLRSALRPNARRSYLDMQRTGRTLPLQKSFRELVLTGLDGWEQKMRDVGVVDHLGIVQALTKYLDNLTPRYRSILVDEAQDLGNVELEIIRRLALPASNDLFLCGDAAQAVTTKYQSLNAIGLAIPPTRSRRLTLNYRNSREVLGAAHSVLLANFTEELLDREDFEILDPEYSAFSATTPLILEAETLEQEIRYALQYSSDMLEDRPHGKACIAICGHSLYEVSIFGAEAGLPVLDGLTTLEGGQVFLSDLEQTKGFEFDVMIVVGCSAGRFPSEASPETERFRDLARLYVAMTRAKTDLVLSWSNRLSPLLPESEEHFLHAEWSEYLSLTGQSSVGVPRRVDSNPSVIGVKKSWRRMTGAEFLYEQAALGLDATLVGRLRELVDGVGLRRARGRRVRWRNLGTAADDFRNDPLSRKEWGPEVGKLFAALIARLEDEAGPYPQPPETIAQW